MKCTPSLEDAAADTGTDREVDEAVGSAPVAPVVFGERGGVDVGIDANRTREPARQPWHDLSTGPTGLGGGANTAEVLGQRVEGDGPEAAYPERRERRDLPPAAQPPDQAFKGRIGITGRHPEVVDDGAALPEHRSDLRAAEFDSRNPVGIAHVEGLSKVSSPTARWICISGCASVSIQI
jgi:hypothetical protein